MSDDLLKRLESVKRWHKVTAILTSGSVSERDDAPYEAAARIRHQRDLLNECEQALDDIANGTSHSDTCSYALTPHMSACDCHRAVARDMLAKLCQDEGT